jgi:2-C-methyl-D-erythritol 4-phosphate cytidylyltransferase
VKALVGGVVAAVFAGSKCYDARMPIPPRSRVAGVVLAAGTGTRVGASRNKAYLPLGGRRILSWSLDVIRRAPRLSRLVLVIREADRDLAAEVLAEELPGTTVELVVGGATRHESEHRALEHLAGSIEQGRIDLVLIHDAARPLTPAQVVRRVITAAERDGAAIPGMPVEGVLEVDDLSHLAGGDHERLVTVQTPQAFRAGSLLAAYRAAASDGFAGTDTAACAERYSELRVTVVPGDQRNIKVTYAHDLFVAERLLDAATGPDDEVVKRDLGTHGRAGMQPLSG